MVSYSMPFVLLSAIVINVILTDSGLSGTPYRLIFLGAAFPIGFSVGRSYVSILIDRYGRPNLRLYKSADGEYVDLPISRTNAKPQEFRDHVQRFLSTQRTQRISPQVVEAS